jgi:hypothetical protein
MILESSSILSGVTSSPAQLLAFGEILSGNTISLGQLLLTPELLSGSSLCAGNVNFIYARIPPNTFNLLFGNNAYQDASIIRINKPDLSGLTPQENNTAESLLVGIIARLLINNRKVFTPKIDIEFWGCGYSDNKRIDTLLIKAYNLLSTTNNYEIADYNNTINPNNY